MNRETKSINKVGGPERIAEVGLGDGLLNSSSLGVDPVVPAYSLHIMIFISN